MNGGSGSLRFGVIAGERLRRWEAACLDHLLALPGARLELLIVPWDVAPSGRAGNRWAPGLFARRSRAWRWDDGPPVLREVPKLAAPAVPGPAGWGLPESETEAVLERGLDFILSLVDCRWKGRLLEAAGRGLWAFRHEGRPAPGVPPGFWQVARGERAIGAALTALGERPEEDRVLKQGFVKVWGHSYAETADAILFECARWPAQVSARLRGRGRGPAAGPAAVLAPGPAGAISVGQQGPAPGLRDAARLVAAAARRWVGEVADYRLRHDVWNVGLVRAPIQAFLAPGFRPAVEWLPHPRRGTFLADPFGVMHRDRPIVLAEEFDYRMGLGRLSSVDLSEPPAARRPRPVLVRPHHLSYPFLFEHEGEIFCVPETYQAGEVALYRADPFPHRWVKVATLLQGVRAVDSTVFRHGDRWWLTCTMQGPTENTDLYLYHAPDLLGPWTPHAANPVKTDVRSARPGGTPFWHEGSLYRPAQDCSRTYGGGITITRIVALTPEEFEEEPVTAVGPPKDGAFRAGLHTLSALGGVTLIDAKRRVPSPGHALRMVRRRLGPGKGRGRVLAG